MQEEVKRLHATFTQQPMTGLTNASKREHKTEEKCHICLKEFNDLKNKKVTAATLVYIEEQLTIIAA